MIKTNIKMRVTPEQSRKVQENCFSNGIYWAGENKDKVRIYSNYLYIRGLIKHDTLNNSTYFNDVKEEEIDADLFIKTNGTCEENATDEYYDLREALAKGKIIQLNGTAVNGGYGETWNDCKQEDLFIFSRNAYRIKDKETYLTKYTSQPKDLESALKKKRDKNKNQALEITKLLEQKKDLEEDKYTLATENKYLKLDKINIFGKIAKLQEQLEEKDTIISYLESKLK